MSPTRSHPKRFSRSSHSWTISGSFVGIVHWITLCTQTPAPISPAAPVLIYHHGHDRQHICAWMDWVRKGGSEGGTTVGVGVGQREGKNMVARRIGIAQSAWLFKGHILFEGPHPTLRSTSVCPSHLLPQLSPSATGQFIVLGYLIAAHIQQVWYGKALKSLRSELRM